MPTREQSIKNLPDDIRGEKNGHWKGGIHYRKDGYVLVRMGVIPRAYKGSRYKLLHRIVMEKKMGRLLKRSEIVHHKDGNKGNNKVSNLKVITQSEHAKIHYQERIKNNGRLV